MTDLDWTADQQLDQLLDLVHKARTTGIDSLDVLESDDEAEDETDEAVVVHLDNGSFHVCRGTDCPHARPALSREKCLVCGLSGRVISSNVEAPSDAAWTGRSCGSADPDMTSGAVPARCW